MGWMETCAVEEGTDPERTVSFFRFVFKLLQVADPVSASGRQLLIVQGRSPLLARIPEGGGERSPFPRRCSSAPSVTISKTVTPSSMVGRLTIRSNLGKISDRNQIIEAGVMMTPALMVDGKVKSSGKVLTPEQITALLT
jgi:Thioredoxin domain